MKTLFYELAENIPVFCHEKRFYNNAENLTIDIVKTNLATNFKRNGNVKSL